MVCRHIVAPQRPPLHMPEQHDGEDVQTSLAPRQVPPARQVPITHVRPTQHSFGAQASFTCLHWSRQVKVAALQKPAQHS